MLSVDNATISFATAQGQIHAVQDVSFVVQNGETVGIVGESGCGKSVLCLSLLGLLPMPPARQEAGEALFNGTDLYALTQAQLRDVRGNQIGMIFQDPMTALNPYMRIGDQVIEPLLVHKKATRAQAYEKAHNLLSDIGIADVASVMKRYPHELSGGMRQRVMIAMTVLPHPSLLIADEPTTALDVTVQDNIIMLLSGLQKNYAMSMIFVTHDLGVVARIATRVLVMYAGQIVESAPVAKLFASPAHPYTKALLDAMPSLHKRAAILNALGGMPPDLKENMTGCSFAPRCAYVKRECRLASPLLLPVSEQHSTRCFRVQDGSIAGAL